MNVLTRVASVAGQPGGINEDYVAVGGDTVAVLDGLTARTETGCIHGVRWYVERLAKAIIATADLGPRAALEEAIRSVAALHSDTCDLSHPATPAAAVAIAQARAGELRYLVLCDTTLVLDTTEGLTVVTDDRLGMTASAERAAADLSPVGTPEKEQALLRMKRAELTARNSPGGYWVASSNPDVANHAIEGVIPTAEIRRGAILTDGAARLVEPFNLMTWQALLDVLSASDGPAELLRRTRAIEAADPKGTQWPRNKTSDDATVVYFVP